MINSETEFGPSWNRRQVCRWGHVRSESLYNLLYRIRVTEAEPENKKPRSQGGTARFRFAHRRSVAPPLTGISLAEQQ